MEQEGIDRYCGGSGVTPDIYWLSDWPSSREAYLLMQAGKEPVILMVVQSLSDGQRCRGSKMRWAGANTTNSVVDQLRARHESKIGRSADLLPGLQRCAKYPNASFIDLGGAAHDAHGQERAEIERPPGVQVTDQSIQASRRLKAGVHMNPGGHEPVLRRRLRGFIS
jgi:hypothetical protein